MAANPIELVGGLATTANVVKADLVGWAKARVAQVLANATEVRNTVLGGQLVLTLKSNGQSWFLDTTDTTSPDDGINCIISQDGKRFKPLSFLPLPTTSSIGGVFASAAVTNQFLTGIGTDGNVTRAQPSAANLSNGTTGSGAVVLASGATLTAPNIDTVQILAGPGTAGLTFPGDIATARWLIGLNGAYKLGFYNEQATPALSGATPVYGGNTYYPKVLFGKDGTIQFAGPIQSGVAGSQLGAVYLFGSTSGNTVIQPQAAASGTLTLPAATDTLVGRATADTLTNKSINASNNTVSNLTTAMFAVNVVDTDATLAANSTTRLATQSAVKSYIDNLLTGLSWKGAVAAATTANITLSGTQTIDGVAVVAGNRVLVKNQTTGSQNGVYVVAAGAWSRASDMDAAAEFPGAAVFVAAGTVNADTQWVCSNDSVTVGTTAVVFAQVSGAGTYSAGTGLTLSGNQFAIDSTVVTLTGAQTLTNKTLTAPNLGTPTAITLTNGTGLPISTGVSGLASGIAAFLATPSSANLRAALTDESGTGAAYFQGGDIGTPSAGVLTNATGLPTAGLVNNAVTLAKMQTIATASFLGRTTASTGNVENLNATQATAILNALIGDSGSGGTKGLVPAPAAGDFAAGKYLDAGGNWSVPAGGGGGGGMSTTERQNFALSTIYQSKLYSEYRRLVGMFATGFKGATDTLNGINAGSSSGYAVDSSNGFIAPSTTPGSNQIPLMTAATTSGVTMSADTEFSGSFPAYLAGNRTPSDFWSSTSSAFPHWLKTDFGAGKTIASYTVQVRSDGSNAPTAWTLEGSNDNSSWTTKDTQTGQSWTGGQIKTFSISSPASFRYYRLNVSAGTDATTLQIAEITLLTAAVVNNMTAVTTSQSIGSSVSNGRVLLEFDNSASPALNTDLTVEVTCNGGTNWTSATLSNVGVGQSGRVVAETADTACTGGTSFAMRIKTLNNKNVPIYGASLLVH